MHKQHENEASYKSICEAKKHLIEEVISQLNKGVEQVNANELGEVTDMIKDLAEAEKLVKEACYYESIVEAMDEASDDSSGRYGYRKRVMPYPPILGDAPYIDDYLQDMDPYEGAHMRMGYPKRSTSNSSRSNRGNTTRSRDSMGRYTSGRSGYDKPDYDRYDDDDMDWDPRYGQAYNDYKLAQRHYTESHTQADKDTMNKKANEHIADTVNTIRDMWKDADPALRKRMKSDFSSLLNEMNV